MGASIYTTDGYTSGSVSYDTFCLVTGSTPLVQSSCTTLLGALVTNETGSTLWAQLFDGYSQPAGLTVPIAELQIAG